MRTVNLSDGKFGWLRTKPVYAKILSSRCFSVFCFLFCFAKNTRRHLLRIFFQTAMSLMIWPSRKTPVSPVTFGSVFPLRSSLAVAQGQVDFWFCRQQMREGRQVLRDFRVNAVCLGHFFGLWASTMLCRRGI